MNPTELITATKEEGVFTNPGKYGIAHVVLPRSNAQPASTSLGDDRLKNRTGLFGSAKLGAQCGCCMATRLRTLEIEADSLKIPSDTFQFADFLPRIMLGVCTIVHCRVGSRRCCNVIFKLGRPNTACVKKKYILQRFSCRKN